MEVYLDNAASAKVKDSVLDTFIYTAKNNLW
jgi:hypothetical protein